MIIYLSLECLFNMLSHRYVNLRVKQEWKKEIMLAFYLFIFNFSEFYKQWFKEYHINLKHAYYKVNHMHFQSKCLK